jgi:hypothetical protein
VKGVHTATALGKVKLCTHLCVLVSDRLLLSLLVRIADVEEASQPGANVAAPTVQTPSVVMSFGVGNLVWPIVGSVGIPNSAFVVITFGNEIVLLIRL